MLNPKLLGTMEVRPHAAKAYMARPITDIADDSDARVLIDGLVNAIDEACARADFDAYDPNRFSGLHSAPDMKPPLVYQTDLARVLEADALVALLTPTSFGVAMEIFLAGLVGRPVVVVYPRRWHNRPFKWSRMLEGCAARIVASVAFDDARDELPRHLDRALKKLREAVDAVEKIPPRPGDGGLSHRLSSARHAVKLSEEDFAARMGVSLEQARVLEGGGVLKELPKDIRVRFESQILPSLELLRRIAAVLGTTVGWLLDGEAPPPATRLTAAQWATDDVRASWDNLLVAVRKERAHKEALDRVWRQFESDRLAAATAPAIAGEVIGNRKAWTVGDFQHGLRRAGTGTLFDEGA